MESSWVMTRALIGGLIVFMFSSLKILQAALDKDQQSYKTWSRNTCITACLTILQAINFLSASH